MKYAWKEPSMSARVKVKIRQQLKILTAYIIVPTSIQSNSNSGNGESLFEKEYTFQFGHVTLFTKKIQNTIE